MDISYIDIIGFTAAIITNVSLYPQAYNVYIIISTHNYERLYTLSLYTFMTTSFGCCLWIIYGVYITSFPIIFGSAMSLLPSCYISCILLYSRYLLYNSDITIADVPSTLN